MEHYAIKSVAFGGFDKQDVVRYIEQAAQESAAAQRSLQEENDRLRAQVDALEQENCGMKDRLAQLEPMQEQLNAATAELETLPALRSENAALKNANAALESSISAVRADAESYAQLREQLGSIECEARNRAAELEAKSAEEILSTANLFYTRYQELVQSFETASSHVLNELRQMEVNFTQLPRTMDAPGKQLDEVMASLEQIKANYQK